MAKVSAVQRNNKRKNLAKKNAAKRAALKAVIMDKNASIEDKLDAQFKLQALPKNSAPNRIRNRCGLTGRPRGVYRKFELSRISLRELGSAGQIPGLIKSSW